MAKSLASFRAKLFYCILCAGKALFIGQEAAAAHAHEAPPRLKISELLADQKKWNNAVVEVSGYYMSDLELSSLYESREDALEARNKQGLWIGFKIKTGHKDKVKALAKGWVRIIGRFEYKPDGAGHFGRWPAQITELELMEPLIVDSNSTNHLKRVIRPGLIQSTGPPSVAVYGANLTCFKNDE